MSNWQSGLYDCFDDCDICCYGYWCTSCLYGENAVQIDGSDYDDACVAFLISRQNPFGWMPIVDNRTALRNKYGLAEEPCDDCLVIFCCTPCAVCQAARELKIRNNMSGAMQPTVITAEPINNRIHPQRVRTAEPISIIRLQQR